MRIKKGSMEKFFIFVKVPFTKFLYVPEHFRFSNFFSDFMRLVIPLVCFTASLFAQCNSHSHSHEPPASKYSAAANQGHNHGHAHAHSHSHSHSHSHGGHGHTHSSEEEMDERLANGLGK